MIEGLVIAAAITGGLGLVFALVGVLAGSRRTYSRSSTVQCDVVR